MGKFNLNFVMESIDNEACSYKIKQVSIKCARVSLVLNWYGSYASLASNATLIFSGNVYYFSCIVYTYFLHQHFEILQMHFRLVHFLYQSAILMLDLISPLPGFEILRCALFVCLIKIIVNAVLL